MLNTPQNPNQNTHGDRTSNPSQQGTASGQKVREGSFEGTKNNDLNTTRQKIGNVLPDESKGSGMKNDPQASDTRREREEEDRPRAQSK
jgi:hypothetical protein